MRRLWNEIFTVDNVLHTVMGLVVFVPHLVLTYYVHPVASALYCVLAFLFIRELTQIQAHLGNDIRKGWDQLTLHKVMEAVVPTVFLGILVAIWFQI